MSFTIHPIIEIKNSLGVVVARLTHDEAKSLALEIMKAVSPLAKTIQIETVEINPDRFSDLLKATRTSDAVRYPTSNGIYDGSFETEATVPVPITTRNPDVFDEPDFQPTQLQAEATTGEVVTGDRVTPEKVQEVVCPSPKPASAESNFKPLGPLPSVKSRIQFQKGSMDTWCRMFEQLANGAQVREVAENMGIYHLSVLSFTTSADRFINHAQTLTGIDRARYIRQVIDAQKARCQYHGVDFYADPNYINESDLPIIVGRPKSIEVPAPSNDHQVPEPVQIEPEPAPESNDRQVKPGLKIPGWSAETVAKVVELVRTDPYMTIGIFLIEWKTTHGYQFSEIEKDDIRAYWNDIKKEAAR